MKENLSFVEIIKMLKKHMALIVISTLFAAMAAFGITRFFIPPQYSADILMYVNVRNSETGNPITMTDINTAQKLVSTYLEILKSETSMESIAEGIHEKTGKLFTPAQLRGMIKASIKNDTEIFSIEVTYTDPDMAKSIANEIAEKLPSSIQGIMEAAGEVKVIDWATTGRRTGPNLSLNILIGAFAGFALAALFILLKEFFDKTISSEENLRSKYQVPILGVIPHYNVRDENGEVS